MFARRVKGARERRGWSQQQLADELKRLGYALPRSTLAKIENERSPRADARLRDVLALAAALRVPPVHLLTPLEDDGTLAITPKVRLDSRLARAWIRGEAMPPMAPDVDLREIPESELLELVLRDLVQGFSDPRLARLPSIREGLEAEARRRVELILNPPDREKENDG